MSNTASFHFNDIPRWKKLAGDRQPNAGSIVVDRDERIYDSDLQRLQNHFTRIREWTLLTPTNSCNMPSAIGTLRCKKNIAEITLNTLNVYVEYFIRTLTWIYPAIQIRTTSDPSIMTRLPSLIEMLYKEEKCTATLTIGKLIFKACRYDKTRIIESDVFGFQRLYNHNSCHQAVQYVVKLHPESKDKEICALAEMATYPMRELYRVCTKDANLLHCKLVLKDAEARWVHLLLFNQESLNSYSYLKLDRQDIVYGIVASVLDQLSEPQQNYLMGVLKESGKTLFILSKHTEDNHINVCATLRGDKGAFYAKVHRINVVSNFRNLMRFLRVD